MISISQFGLICAIALAVYIIRRCVQPPNAPPKNRHARDTLFNNALVQMIFHLSSIPVIAIGILHSIIVATSSDFNSLALCPHPENLNMTYFSWTPYTISCLASIYIFGCLRIMAFGNLGKSFTFELAKPDKLVTTGMYGYVQHPSYTALFVVLLGMTGLFLPMDAAVGCVLSSRLIETWNSPLLVSTPFFICYVLYVRVRDEEVMLKEAFGKEWVEWHSTTPRFIPFLI